MIQIQLWTKKVSGERHGLQSPGGFHRDPRIKWPSHPLQHSPTHSAALSKAHPISSQFLDLLLIFMCEELSCLCFNKYGWEGQAEANRDCFWVIFSLLAESHGYLAKPESMAFFLQATLSSGSLQIYHLLVYSLWVGDHIQSCPQLYRKKPSGFQKHGQFIEHPGYLISIFMEEIILNWT